jgi:hypothetical protein
MTGFEHPLSWLLMGLLVIGLGIGLGVTQGLREDDEAAQREAAVAQRDAELAGCNAQGGEARCLCLESMAIRYETGMGRWQERPLGAAADQCRHDTGGLIRGLLGRLGGDDDDSGGP